jgi:hypothetical protein
MFHAKAFSADYAYTYCFTILIIFKAIVTFQHNLTTSTNFIKQTVLFQSFMAGNTDNSFDVFLVRLKFYRIVTFPYRGFLMDKVLFANSSPAYDTNSHGVRIFALSGTFIAFHCFTSRSENLVLIRLPNNFMSDLILYEKVSDSFIIPL